MSVKQTTGTLEQMTPEEEQIYAAFYERFEVQLAEYPIIKTKWSLLRFLRARKFNLNKATEMLNAYIEFRKKYPYDKVMKTPIAEFDLIYKHYACGYCHYDFDGNLVVIDEVAKSDPEKIFECVTEDQIIKFLIQKHERMIYLVMPFLSRYHNKRIDRTCLIIDLKNVKTSLFFNKKVREFLAICSKMGQDYYPEILARCFVINAPFLFKGIWSFVATMLDERTVNKFFIESNDGLKVLKQYLDVDKLPVSMGGKNMEALSEANGPWKNDLLSSYERLSFFFPEGAPEYDYYYTQAEKKEFHLKKQASIKKEAQDHSNSISLTHTNSKFNSRNKTPEWQSPRFNSMADIPDINKECPKIMLLRKVSYRVNMDKSKSMQKIS